MELGRAYARLGSAARAIRVIAATAALAVVAATSDAQTPPAAPARPAAPKQAQPKAPGPQPTPPPGAAPGQEPPKLAYTPWQKLCGKNPQDPSGREFCQTGREARLENGQFLASATLVEVAGDEKRLLHVVLPFGLLLQQGTRIVVDGGQPLTAPYFICIVAGCVAQYELTQEFVGKLKKGQMLELQGVNPGAQMMSIPVPLAEFAKANEGPPTDPKTLQQGRAPTK